MNGQLAIAIDPSYISKVGKKTPHIGRFWSGCASAMKHGLEILGIGLVDVNANTCMMLRAHQTTGTSSLKQKNQTLVGHYISVLKRYAKELLRLADVIVAVAYFSTSIFERGISSLGFYLVSRFRDDAHLCYLYEGPRTGRSGRPKQIDGQIDFKNLDLSRMDRLEIDGLDGDAYSLMAYSKAMQKNVRLVIWIMPGGKHKLFFSTKTAMTGEEVLRTYRSRFQIEFCFRDDKQFTGLTDCQARHTYQLDFAFNASLASLNAAKVLMKENGLENSMANLKSLMFKAYYTKIIFAACRHRPNRNLISHIVKELIGWQPKAA